MTFFFGNEGFAQLDKQKKEEISITSSFKPSIIKSSKIEFRPESLSRDTSSYKLKYSPVKLSFTTPMSGFTIKPLAYRPRPIESDSSQLSVQIGYGNLHSPQTSLNYASTKRSQQFSIYADFLSMKGKLPLQQHSTGDIGLSFKNHISETYQYNLTTSVQDYNYRTYGFEKNPSIPLFEVDLRQHFTNYNALATLTNVAGEEGKINLRPLLKFDYLTTNYKFNSVSALFSFPLQYQWKKNVLLKYDASLTWTNLSSFAKTSSNTVLIMIPLGADIAFKKWLFDLIVYPTYAGNRVNVMPNVHFKYSAKKDELTLSGGLKSIYEINTPYKLLLFNPFVRPVLNASVYEQHKLFTGIELFNKQGFSIDGEAAFVFHKNLPLFINSGILGKDFQPIFESSIKTVEIKSSLSYSVSPKMSVNTTFKWTNFVQQTDYLKPYGLLPFDMQFDLKWKPVNKLAVLFNTNLWTGCFAKNPVSSQTIKMKTVAELNLDLNYNLNQKWAFWIDLNNIANIQYQRWNQYAAYGFNFRSGVKFRLGSTTSN
jgi:hypothetical protein